MSFGASTGENLATGGQGAAVPAIGQGLGNIQSGANFFNTLLSGNRANTMSLLQPDINRIQQMNQGALQGASTLMPRGGGRFATLFNQPFQTNRALTDLFGGLRGQAASALPGIGAQQAQIGTTNAQNLFNNAFQQRQYGNNMIGSLIGSGLGLATLPFSGAPGGLLGKGLGKLFS